MKDIGRSLFVTGVGTDVGKTVSCAVLVEALQGDYWKPIQCGSLNDSDSHKIDSWCRKHKKIHPETYRLKAPKSPHIASSLEGIRIDLQKFEMPSCQSNHLVIEGAGGVLVPLNDRDWVIDIPLKLNTPVVLVSKNYLGSFNHTFMSIEVMKHRGINIKGLIVNGPKDQETEDFIEKRTDIPVLFSIDQQENLGPKEISQIARKVTGDIEKWIDKKL